MTPDAAYLKEACLVGATQSTDPHTQNGAVLRARNGITVAAANQMPPIAHIPARFERPEKYTYVEHAERHVIYVAARTGLATHDATMYCPWFACADCARAIILAGISRVVGHTKPRELMTERWKQSVAVADVMLQEAGIETVLLDAPLDVRFLFNGEFIDL